MKIKISTLILLLTCLLFASTPYLSQTINNIIFLLTNIILILILIHRGLTKSVIIGNLPIIFFGLLMTVATFINLGFSSRTLNAFVTGLRYIMIFVTITQISMDITFRDVANILFKILFIVTTIEDICVLFTNGNGIVNDGTLAYFFFGNKFGVSYLHMFTIALLLLHIFITRGFNTRKIVFWIYLLYSIILCRIADCNTGVIGCLVIGLMVFIAGKQDRIIAFIDNQIIFLAVFIGSTFLLVGTDLILGNDYISELLLKYSHTNKILSGRVDMYKITLYAIAQNPIWGYGINNTIVEDILSWGNAQNGLLKMLLDYGVIGTAGFLLVCWNAIKQRRGANVNKLVFPSLIFLYAMAICSMVEINISGYFFAGLALVHAAQLTGKKQSF